MREPTWLIWLTTAGCFVLVLVGDSIAFRVAGLLFGLAGIGKLGTRYR